MTPLRIPFGLCLAAVVLLGWTGKAGAQVPLYAQRLPESTVYIRLASALPAAATVSTEFAGKVELGADGASRISPYFIAVSAGGETQLLRVNQAGKAAIATFEPKLGTFITVVLHPKGDDVTASIVTDKPEYNQLKARLTFYNATNDCPAGALSEQVGRTIFSNVPPNGVQARSINPVTATVAAVCGGAKAPRLSLGQLDAGGLYSVWMMRPEGQLTTFLARDTIAPPRG